MKYAIISNQKRAILLRRVLKQKEPIKFVAQDLKIKFPSAKSIIRTYKKTGRVFNKKKTRRVKELNSQKTLPIEQKKICQKVEIQNSKSYKSQEMSQKNPNLNQNLNNVENNRLFCQPLLTYSIMPQVTYPYTLYNGVPQYGFSYPY